MSGPATLILILYIAAFLIFVLRFYFREGAASVTAPSFLLAVLTVVLAFSYLGLGMFLGLFAYAPIVFGVIGAGLLAFGIYRMFQL